VNIVNIPSEEHFWVSQPTQGLHQPTSSHPFQPENGLSVHAVLCGSWLYHLSIIPAVGAVSEQDLLLAAAALLLLKPRGALKPSSNLCLRG